LEKVELNTKEQEGRIATKTQRHEGTKKTEEFTTKEKEGRIATKSRRH